MIEPVMEAFTTSCRPFCRASRAIMSSAALPNVAFSKPPIPGPVRSARCSVAFPICPARGTIARAETMKTDTGLAWMTSSTSPMGINTRRTLKGSMLKRPRCMRLSSPQHLPDAGDDARRIRQAKAFHNGAVWDGHIRRANTFGRRFEGPECGSVFGQERRHLGGSTTGHARLIDDDHAHGLLDRGAQGALVHGYQGSGIHHFDRDGLTGQCLRGS